MTREETIIRVLAIALAVLALGWFALARALIGARRKLLRTSAEVELLRMALTAPTWIPPPNSGDSKYPAIVVPAEAPK